jgi:hypothetical protein
VTYRDETGIRISSLRLFGQQVAVVAPERSGALASGPHMQAIGRRRRGGRLGSAGPMIRGGVHEWMVTRSSTFFWELAD